MNTKVLFVDDEPHVLDGIRRQLRKRYEVVTAVGPEEGLEKLAAEGPFAVVVSDMRMPVMDGATFLARVRAEDPDAVRMVLSGQSDMDMTISAVNQGNIFRFLTKPCETADLAAAIDQALEQYRLVIAERELLQGTLSGAVGLLNDVLAMTSPAAFSRVSATQRVLTELVEHLDRPLNWEWKLAGMLSYIGCVSIPDETVKKAFAGQQLDELEEKAFAAHPEVASKLLARIPRLQEVADIIGAQSGAAAELATADFSTLTDQQIGGQCLLAATHYSAAISAGETRGRAFDLVRVEGIVHPVVLEALAKVRVDSGSVLMATAAELRPGVHLDQDVLNAEGKLLLAEGYEVTDAIIVRLRNHSERGDLQEPFRVRTATEEPTNAPTPEPVAAATG
ncbi:MAG: response regulator [Gemmatimonadetes bacterium]|nr:response regulator [Gemmatimonadota bacterium]